jgi:hypothetical protein
VILNTHGASVNSPEVAEDIAIIAAAAPNSPLVLLSDLDEPTEVIRAIQLGARGWSPSGIRQDAPNNTYENIPDYGHIGSSNRRRFAACTCLTLTMDFSPLSQALGIGVPERRLGVQHHNQFSFDESGFLKTPIVAACSSP